MTLTFSTFKTSNSNSFFESDDYVKLIELSKNFSKDYNSENSPENAIEQKQIKSVVFKYAFEKTDQTIVYQFWKSSYAEPDYYFITVSKISKDLISIEDKMGYSVPVKFFKITDQNEVDIVIYATPRL